MVEEKYYTTVETEITGIRDTIVSRFPVGDG